MWATPEILTWDAWLARQWRIAVQRGSAPPAQLLSTSQERALWEAVLQELGADGLDLSIHAGGLIRAAGRATQSLLQLSRSAISDEEKLLAEALAAVRARCAAGGLMSLRLAPPEQLGFLREVPAPAIVGEPRLTPLQLALQQQCWEDTPLLLATPLAEPAEPRLRRFAALEAELAACGQWCLDHLRKDPAARLLVLSACTEPALAVQGELLWRQLAGSRLGEETLRQRLLAVEGGSRLAQLGLIGDALVALECLEAQVDTERLYALLRSPYFQFGTQDALWDLQGRFERWGLARWRVEALREALASVARKDAAAAELLAWLEALAPLARPGERCMATEWARRFSDGLARAGFGRTRLDTREQQRLARWGELLDEFAGLDAVSPPMGVEAALQRLKGLAAEGRHQGASGDAAVTLTGALADPVVDYDGIWVLGLAESRWPAPPRPDPYVAVQEQRAQQWPEASAAQRRGQALWALSRWRQRTRELVLGYPEQEGDLQHRPTALLGVPREAWQQADGGADSTVVGFGAVAEDQQFPAVPAAQLTKPLPGGADRLRIQQQCAFRAQAQWRLKAMAPGEVSDGLTPALRGSLLHALLQGLWGELKDQATLLALTPQAEHALLQKHWEEALEVENLASLRWMPASLLARERARTLAVLSDVLRLERERAPFTVQARENRLEWPGEGARFTLRIDRIDAGANGARLLLDYKSGAPERVKLHEGELEPLQLAIYATALAARGEPVQGAALFSLKPGEIALTGAAAAGAAAPEGLKPVEDWDATAAGWRQSLLALLARHLAGDGTLAHERTACRYCHLPALCRRAAEEDLEPEDE